MVTTPSASADGRECFAGGLAVELEVPGDGGGEGGFAGGVAVSGVLPVGEDEDGVRLEVVQAEGCAFWAARKSARAWRSSPRVVE